MSEPTSLGDSLGELSPRLRARLERANRECERHPGNRAGDCADCAGDAREASERQERDEVLTEAGKAREKFPLRFRQATTDHPVILGWANQFRADPRETPSLLLVGPTGTGKTHNAYGAVAEAVRVARRNRAGVYYSPRWQALTHADLCASLRPQGRDHSPETVLERYRGLDLLMIDDLGAAKATEFVEEATYRLVNGRYEDMRPSIFTSNLPLADLREAVGDRIASRLAETCTRVVLDGPDRRRMPRAA
jgi:DNA replication protein DnaC